MISAVSVQNFKCYQDARFEFESLNLLTGINGRGKSTAIQPLLLMRQTIEHDRAADHLLLNGSCVEMGTFADLRNASLPRGVDTSILFETRNSPSLCLKYVLSEPSDDDMTARVSSLSIVNQEHPSQRMEYAVGETQLRVAGRMVPLFWRDLWFDHTQEFFPLPANALALFRRIHYVSADRMGPRDFHLRRSFHDFPNVGARGELTANVLLIKRDDLVRSELCLSTASTRTLIDQVGAWLELVFDGGRVRVKGSDANIAFISLGALDDGPLCRPVNVGYGYSYALPIVVSGLIAREGEVLIVENPEAHLHPFAQSQLARFLALVASGGVQVFIESHSDHILNGLRIAVKDDAISNDALRVLFFEGRERIHHQPIEVGPAGEIEHWPGGFFDQLQLDFSRLFG